MKNIRIHNSRLTNFGEVLVLDFDEGFIKIPAHVKGNTELINLMIPFGVDADLLKAAEFETNEEAEAAEFVECAIKINGYDVEKGIDNIQQNGGLPFGDYFLKLKPSEKLQKIADLGLFVIIQL